MNKGNFVSVVILLLLVGSIEGDQTCIPMWNPVFESNLADQPPMCPVVTTNGSPCILPFKYAGVTYKTCTIWGPNNPASRPQCAISVDLNNNARSWSFCIVPTDAAVSYVTVRKGGYWQPNGGSIEGGTMLWIYGQRFAPNLFSSVPSSSSSNAVQLVDGYSVYDCEVHNDKTTLTQLTCYTPALPSRLYQVRVYVNGHLIPLYQYIDPKRAVFIPMWSQTPAITSIIPASGTPQSLFQLSGTFRTSCYSRDIEGCAQDNNPLISRIFIGGHLCNLLDSTNASLYDQVTDTSLRCLFEGTEVGVFNVSMLVTNEFGRAWVYPNLFRISANEDLYNIQSYAVINSVTPSEGSTDGGTTLTINGNYFSDSRQYPLIVRVGGQPCTILDSDQTIIHCQTTAMPNSPSNQYSGGRGLEIFRTSSASSASALFNGTPPVPPNSIVPIWTDDALYLSRSSGAETVWLIGFFRVMKSATYSFWLDTNGVAALYLSTNENPANKVLIVTSNVTSSAPLSLQNNTNYYLFCVGSRASGYLRLGINARLHETFLTAGISSNVVNEIQRIDVISNVTVEEQEFVYTTNVINGTSELQSLQVDFSVFQIGFRGVYTAIQRGRPTPIALQTALNDLPTIYPQRLTVFLNNSRYMIQFPAEMGDVPLLTCISSSSNSPNVTEEVAGIESGSFLAFIVDGQWTEYIDVTNTPPAQPALQSIFDNLFMIQCPPSINDPRTTSSIVYAQDFESNCVYDHRDITTQAFCGRCAFKGNTLLSGNTASGHILCFAYRVINPIIISIGLGVQFNGDTTLTTWTSIPFSPIVDQQWHYTCVDIRARLVAQSTISSAIRVILIQQAWLNNDVQNNAQLDSVTIRTAFPIGYEDNNIYPIDQSANQSCVFPFFFNGKSYSACTLDNNLMPICADQTNQTFPCVSSSIEGVRRYYPKHQLAYNSLRVNYSLQNSIIDVAFRYSDCARPTLIVPWPDNTTTVTQLAAASDGVSGTFDIVFNNRVYPSVPVNIEVDDFANRFQSSTDFGFLKVQRTGDCTGYTYTLEWIANGGAKSLITINNTASVLPNGTNVTSSRMQAGGVLFQPLSGDLTRTFRTISQTEVIVGGYAAKCGNITACNFQWSSNQTPTVSSVAQNGSILNIIGTGFSTIINLNTVTIGAVGRCNVTAATSTSLSCTILTAPAGAQTVRVNVDGKGLATSVSIITANVPLQVTSISPTQGGAGGGYRLTIVGVGFSSASVVTMGNNVCSDPIVTDFTSLTCIVPYSTTMASISVSVVVISGTSSVTAPSQFTYNVLNTPTITSYTPNRVTASEEVLNITGTNFGNILATVTIGTIKAAVQSTTPTKIIAILPALPPGLHSISILTSNGFVRPLVTIENSFYVQSISPQVGSLYGGGDVYIQGQGFDNRTEVSFTDGSTAIPCPILSTQSDQIHCRTKSVAPTVIISATGVHPQYGIGFAWSPLHATVEQGAIVQWRWGSSSLLTTLSYKVQQVADSQSVNLIPGGFDSGNGTAQGSYSYQFQTVGTYYYLSPSVDQSSSIHMRGVIHVVPAQPRTLTVNVSSGSYTAQSCAFPFVFNSINYTTCTMDNDTQLWCSPTNMYIGQRLYCTPTNTIPTSSCISSTLINPNSCSQTIPSNSLQFLFTTCTMGTVTSITPVRGAAGTILTITGTGFSTNTCENIVLIGDFYQCPIQSVSTTQIACQIGYSSDLSAATLQSVSVRKTRQGDHSNVGLIQFQFQAQISSISPLQGSIMGGTEVIISGDGFTMDNTRILVGEIEYTLLANITYSQIRFFTTVPPQTYLNHMIPIKVFIGTNPAVCLLNSCSFTWSTVLTPSLSSVNPISITGPQNISITGQNFNPTGFVSLNDIEVRIDGQSCYVISISNSSIDCQIGSLPSGSYSISVSIDNIGKAVSGISLTSSSALYNISPITGSIYGGVILIISGNGFPRTMQGNLQVLVGSNACRILQVMPDQIQCRVPSRTTQTSSSAVVVRVISNGITFPGSMTYTYNDSISPNINGINPTSGTLGQSLIISGSNFVPGLTTVTIGGTSCSVVSITSSTVVCTVNSSPAGDQPVEVTVSTVGVSNHDVQFQYALQVSNISSMRGSYGGGQLLSINGDGLNTSGLTVTICSQPCQSISIVSNTLLTCYTPSIPLQSFDQICSLVVSTGRLNQTLTYVYQANLTAMITNVSPTRGGTGGGTVLTITGTNFNNVIEVTIADIPCTIQSSSSTNIVCSTGRFLGSSIQAPVIVRQAADGVAFGSSQYQYVDLWSSPWTWGGLPPPEEGTLVLIDGGKTIHFDTTTPVLKALLIDNATLIFDDNQDVALNAEYILIINGGHLQIGTESNPFQHRAIITMYGHLRSIELPIFGAKVLALREGIIDMHGIPMVRTWTQLANTAAAGAQNITLRHNIDWPVGSQIVIATTGNYLSQRETEVRTITAVSSNGRTLTLDTPLNYRHLGVTQVVGPTSIEARAEVGLLSHNIVFRGSVESSWLEKIEACPRGFDPGEFAVQTCFLGRYGEEMGSDEFGATIMASGANDTSDGAQLVILRLSNIEVTNAGQAFRLGRYPVHFHMNGNMNQSYIKSSSIHYTFNRAVNIHASRFVTVENNVVYNVKGGALFLEDGVEVGNTIRSNLIVFVRSSSSLLNEDVTPAAVWVTNPNNTVEHNAVAGGTHFGYWYRMLRTPDGPSFAMSPGLCPYRQPMGRFFNNSVHSVGRFGVWIFPEYLPTVEGTCGNWNPLQAVFDRLIAWNNQRGFEWVMSASVQVRNSIVFDNSDTGIRCVTAADHQNVNIPSLRATFYNENTGSSVIDSIIIGDTGVAGYPITAGEGGLVVMWDRGLRVRNITFINFQYPITQAIYGPVVTGRCSANCGGWLTKFSQLSFINVVNRGKLRWPYDAIYHDEDGSLSNISNSMILSPDNLVNSLNACTIIPNIQAAVSCPVTLGNWIRFAFHQANLGASGEQLHVYNMFNGHIIVPWLLKRLTHPRGYMMNLLARQKYLLQFQNANTTVNISYVGVAYNLAPGDYLIIQHHVTYLPDRVYTVYGLGLIARSVFPLSAASANGDWYYDNATKIFSYIAINPTTNSETIDIPIVLSVVKCRYPNCVPPAQPGLELPATARPSTALFWSNDSHWEFAVNGYSVNESRKPLENSDVYIPRDVWVVIDYPLPRLRSLRIDGVLEFEQDINNTLEVDSILINGGQLIVGWPYNPLRSRVDIVISGSSGVDVQLPNGAGTIGPRVIGVLGGLDLHGIPHNVTWTRLALTASAAQNTLTLSEAVDWTVGDEILITTTDTRIDHVERHKIASISGAGTIIVLLEPLAYTHLVINHVFNNGQIYHVAAAVGLLTRNIRVINRSPRSELFGFRVLVTDYATETWDPIGGTTIQTYYKGYARLKNAQFIGFGQFVNAPDEDKREGIHLFNLARWNASRPTYIDSCVFDGGYNPAIGVWLTDGIPITNNLIYNTYESGIIVNGNDNIIRKNLVSTIYWSGAAQPELAEFNVIYDSAILSKNVETVVMKENLVSGVDRLAYRIQGNACPGTIVPNGVANDYDNNEAHSALAGVSIWPGDKGFSYDQGCVLIKGFKTFKTYHYGFYIITPRNIIYDSVVSSDSNVGIFSLVMGPLAKEHKASDKSITVRNSIILATSTPMDCSDRRDLTTVSATFGVKAVPVVSNQGSDGDPVGRVGISFPYFSNDNLIPNHPFTSISAYPSINGVMIVNNITFVNFNDQCSRQDVVMRVSQHNDDGQHPVLTSNLFLYNTSSNNLVFNGRPNLALVNPSDCVDMDCDGLKKGLLIDTDGSLFGQPSTVFSQAEYNWGNQAHGVGDFRIPRVAMTNQTGNRINISATYPYRGIIRAPSCVYQPAWQMYFCPNVTDYRMLIIESLDSDTETRRLSPVAVMSQGYIDLINGPQDHGWCNGYTCQKRLSTFMAIVRARQNADIYLTSTTPNRMRFRLLNSDLNTVTTVGLFYNSFQQIDVYANDIYVSPTNQDPMFSSLMLLDLPNGVTFNSPPGANYFNRSTQIVTFLISGGVVIDLKMSELIVLTFNLPPTTPNGFFQNNVLANLAALLNIDASKIRRINVITASGDTRLRRQLSTIQLRVEIREDPVSQISRDNGTAAQSTRDMNAMIINLFQSGTLKTRWEAHNATNGTSPISLSVQEPGNQTAIELSIISRVALVIPPSSCREKCACHIQPVLIAYDIFGNAIQKLGSNDQPWQMVASLIGSSNATILGAIANYSDGQTQYQLFGFSELGSYQIAFRFITPYGVSNAFVFNATLTVNTSSVTVLTAVLAAQSLSTVDVVAVSQTFNISVVLIDAISKVQLRDIEWRSFNWSATASLFTLPQYNSNGTLISTSSSAIVVDTTSASITATNLAISAIGMYVIKVQIDSSNNQYSLNTTSNAILVVRNTTNLLVQSGAPTSYITFQGDYYALSASGQLEILRASIYNYLLKIRMPIASNIILSPGSIIASFIPNSASPATIASATATIRQNGANSVDGYPISSITIFGRSSTVDSSSSNPSGSSSNPSGSSSNPNGSSSNSNGSNNVGLIVGLVVGLVGATILVSVSVVSFKQYQIKKNGCRLVNEPMIEEKTTVIRESESSAPKTDFERISSLQTNTVESTRAASATISISMIDQYRTTTPLNAMTPVELISFD